MIQIFFIRQVYMSVYADDKGKSSGRVRLIKAAQELAEKRPFDDITIDEIIKTAELSRPSFYYHFAGAVADMALFFNMLFVMGVMASFQATLTLPGIAGLILTIGMSVDSNVLIYERIREELGSGKPLKTSIEIGYKKAFSAIIDSHITAIITGIILYEFGTGPIQGFALTLIIGLLANLFTAIIITRIVFDVMTEKGKSQINFG